MRYNGGYQQRGGMIVSENAGYPQYCRSNMEPTSSGSWYTYPSEKWWSSSVGMIIPFPTVSGKSFKIPWFQSPPTSHKDFRDHPTGHHVISHGSIGWCLGGRSRPLWKNLLEVGHLQIYRIYGSSFLVWRGSSILSSKKKEQLLKKPQPLELEPCANFGFLPPKDMWSHKAQTWMLRFILKVWWRDQHQGRRH